MAIWKFTLMEWKCVAFAEYRWAWKQLFGKFDNETNVHLSLKMTSEDFLLCYNWIKFCQNFKTYRASLLRAHHQRLSHSNLIMNRIFSRNLCKLPFNRSNRATLIWNSFRLDFSFFWRKRGWLLQFYRQTKTAHSQLDEWFHKIPKIHH